MEQNRGAYRVLVGRLEGKRPLGRPRHRWKIMKLKEVGQKDMNWTDLTQDVTMAGSCEQSTEY
jgi:cell wall assembly regulator SMI1